MFGASPSQDEHPGQDHSAQEQALEQDQGQGAKSHDKAPIQG